ncbi:hypothetical protein LUZ60_004670 [Juncus effusus]|nr:hypothetical protein LUZ60_004670 [Juncus effusus]
MGPSLSPLLRKELENLENKDIDSRQCAMKALKSYARNLDSKNIPQFLAEVSDKQGPRTSPGTSGEFTISLYEVLARVHGKNIIPQIDNIMCTIMSTLSSSGGSFPLHQACSKVVPAIARYGIDQSTPDEEKNRIIDTLCKPLCDFLMAPQESAASGSALCLKALVESNNWKFASNEMVNEVCLKVAGALHEKSTQSNAHMGLVMSLVKYNGLITEAYARSLVQSGLRILDLNGSESNSQKRLSAIQMINFIMKFVDPRSIQSEVDKIEIIMEKNMQNDKMPFVRGAAFEAFHTVKNISGQKGSRHEIGSSPVPNLSFKRKDKSPSRSPNLNNSFKEFASPESHLVESSIKFDSSFGSPGSGSINFGGVRRSNRKLWNGENSRVWNSENCRVDVSLKDGLFLKACEGSNYSIEGFENSGNGELNESGADLTCEFSGFSLSSDKSGATTEITPSPKRPTRQFNMDDIKIYSTPRRLFHALQNSNPNDDVAEQDSDEDTQIGDKNNYENSVIIEKEISNGESKKDESDDEGGNESVDSTADVIQNNVCEVKKAESEVNIVKGKRNIGGLFGLGFSFLLLLFCVIMIMVMNYEEEDVYSYGFVPT